MQHIGHIDGRRSICRTNDGDGSGILQVEEEARYKQGKEDAELCGCTEQHEPWLLKKRSEIDHRTDPDKKQQGEQLVRHARLKECGDRTDRIALGDGA